MEQKTKYIVIGRFWEKDSKSWSGFLDFGILGRIPVRMFVEEKRNSDECDLVITIPSDATLFGSMRLLTHQIEEALWNDRKENDTNTSL